MPHTSACSRPPRSKPSAAAAEKQTFAIGSIAVEVLGHLGHRAPEALRVLLGDHHRQPEDARPAHQRGGVGRHRVEVEHGRPERLLDVDDHQGRAAAVEHPGWRH